MLLNKIPEDIKDLLQAINKVDYEGLDAVEITVVDLKRLAMYIKAQKLAIDVLHDKNHKMNISLVKSELKSLERPLMKLNCYC